MSILRHGLDAKCVSRNFQSAFNIGKRRCIAAFRRNTAENGPLHSWPKNEATAKWTYRQRQKSRLFDGPTASSCLCGTHFMRSIMLIILQNVIYIRINIFFQIIVKMTPGSYLVIVAFVPVCMFRFCVLLQSNHDVNISLISSILIGISGGITSSVIVIICIGLHNYRHSAMAVECKIRDAIYAPKATSFIIQQNSLCGHYLNSRGWHTTAVVFVEAGHVAVF